MGLSRGELGQSADGAAAGQRAAGSGDDHAAPGRSAASDHRSPADAAGLRHFTVELPDQQSLDQVVARVEQAGIPANQTEDGLLVHDPSQNGVILALRHASS